MTRSINTLVQRHTAADPVFGAALLREGIDTVLTGDIDTGKAILRDYIQGTIGFEKPGEATGIRQKSVTRMFGARGNPQARNLFSVLGLPAEAGALQLHVAAFVFFRRLFRNFALYPTGKEFILNPAPITE